ncbi:ABC transporter ATP-binding protein [Rhizobium halophilum]|uniref:ABC transporter ATP-binding protein n=1 Tax=Rhizobium halophilum TaxID=2846852 RepID=UPI001EFCADE6|nr:ABC transporter ATP-binding protein [Rhizobium halophilum]MCF6368156.1 ABC transporter ATP-binding protein/permease [Rhizobium halophilum]
MLDTFRKLRALLSPREQRQALVLLGMMLVAAVVEIAGVASILPFIGVLSDPSIIDENKLLSVAYTYLGFSHQRGFLVFLGSVLLLLFLGSLFFRALTVYAIQRFSLMRIHSIAVRLLKVYMGQKYEFFLHRNSAGLSKSLLSEVATVATSVLLPAMRALSGTIVSLAIVLVLIIVEPLTSLALAALFVGSYLIVDRLTQKDVRHAGELRLKANEDQYRLAGEAIQGLKELRVLGREADYIERFKRPSRVYAVYQSRMLIMREIPFYVIQGAAFGGMLVILLYWIVRGDEINKILPLISFFAFAGYRLLPAFQDVYRSVGQMRFALPALDQLSADMQLATDGTPPSTRSIAPMRFRESLEFKSVDFRYEGAEANALSAFSFTVPARGSIALVGPTGAGKSTVADLILGLLTPTAGTITVDGVALNLGNRRSWQANLGYVPQQIYLTDDTIAANIAFGVPAHEVDRQKVERAARQAQLYEFIMSELPMKFDTVIGERGSRLSGGQRQRLGIARALYDDPKVIVFDEATSALDNQTEAAVMDAIEQLGREKTVVIVAHRFNTIRSCDLICLMDKGTIAGSGRYEELMAHNALFQDLATGGSGR